MSSSYPAPGPPPRSAPVGFFTNKIAGSAGIAFTNQRTNTVAVVTFVGLVNESNGSGDQVLIIKHPFNGAEAAFHSGSAGQGTFDRFPLICEVALQPQEWIGWTEIVGTWHLVVTGYYSPGILQS